MKYKRKLYYIHDPMCSWCWGFTPVWKKVRENLPDDVELSYLTGGLAPDSQEPMPDKMQQFLQDTWRKIQRVIPGTRFNFDFWTKCSPRRSTWPACRATIAAREQGKEEQMIKAIQHAYYLYAQNPSNDSTLIQLATNIGMSAEMFECSLNSAKTKEQLQKEMQEAVALGAQGFPSLILCEGNHCQRLNLDYNDARTILAQL